MKNLLETLQANDLKNIILPILSVDEYDSKIDNKTTVLTFFGNTYDAARDLGRFIEFGAVKVIDTEASPVPDEDGKFLIFVEVKIDNLKDLAILIKTMLKTVSYLTSNTTWKIQTHFGSLNIDVSSK